MHSSPVSNLDLRSVPYGSARRGAADDMVWGESVAVGCGFHNKSRPRCEPPPPPPPYFSRPTKDGELLLLSQTHCASYRSSKRGTVKSSTTALPPYKSHVLGKERAALLDVAESSPLPRYYFIFIYFCETLLLCRGYRRARDSSGVSARGREM